MNLNRNIFPLGFSVIIMEEVINIQEFIFQEIIHFINTVERDKLAEKIGNLLRI